MPAAVAFLVSEVPVSVIDSMKTAFQGMATDVILAVAAIAPIAQSIFACMFIWKQGKKFFSNMGK